MKIITSGIRLSRNYFRNVNFLGTAPSGRFGTTFAAAPSVTKPEIKYLAGTISSQNFCSAASTATEVNIAQYDEIKDLPNHPEKLLIDVREPHELKETGQIPTSINIPLGSVAEALSFETNNEKFKQLYGIEKPPNSTPIIFHCQIGKRSHMASETAMALGYKNVKNYRGSWLDWAERETQ